MQVKTKTRFLTAAAGTTWLMAVGFGLRILLNYENAPGDAGAPPTAWPIGSEISRVSGRATLVMLAHPHCPCTRASITELAQVMASVQGKTDAYVLFLKRRDSPETWEKTDLWKSAAAIPGVTIFADVDGREARRFHIETSGHTLLFDAAGRLLFSGGITASRGHEGDNPGQSALISLLRTDGLAERSRTLVFGCSLFEAEKRQKGNFCLR